MIKKKLILLVGIAGILISMGNSGATDLGIVGSVGMPAGYLDVSYNASIYTRFSFIPPFQTEIKLQDTFGKKSSGDGYVASNVSSIFVLERYDVDLHITGLTPFISGGAGGHLMYSFSGDDSPIHGYSKTVFTMKGHLFVGVDYKLGLKMYITAFGRLTVPSDKVLDCGYLGIGVRL